MQQLNREHSSDMQLENALRPAVDGKAVPATPSSKAAKNISVQVPKAPTKLKTKEAKLALEDDTADFVVICEGKRFMAHKSVLESTSPYFARMFRFNGQESNNKEVEVEDVDQVMMKHILDFMYTDQYTLPGGTAVPTDGWCNHANVALLEGPNRGPQIFKRKCSCSGKVLCPSHLLLHVRIYTVADYFDMKDLKSFARQGMSDVVHVYWKYKGLELADALDEAFTATPDEDAGIRDVLVGLLKEHPGLSVDEGEVQVWLEEHPEVRDRVNWD